jgi:predicted membrane channel-forming protein YqfA (hemolysin III family)
LGRPQAQTYASPTVFIFSIFIALGVRGIIDEIQDRLSSSSVKIPTYIFLVAVMLLVPINPLQSLFTIEYSSARNCE